MQRTPKDRLSMYGNYRIYRSKDLDPQSQMLHQGGPWFIEPKNWDRVSPYSGGYPTFAQARARADSLEEQERERKH